MDQIWLNCRDRLINYKNVVKGASDHNAIICKISLSETVENTHNVLKRSWKNFKINQYKQELRESDWTGLYEISDPELANSWLTEKVISALEKAAPLKRCQFRRNYRGWITDQTKAVMIERDLAKEIHRVSRKENDWEVYRLLRNKCTKLQSTDKKKATEEIFRDIEKNNDSKKLFSITKKLLNWKSGGPPRKLQENGELHLKAEKIANIQMEHFTKKLIKIRSSLGNPKDDPLRLIKQAFSKWKPKVSVPLFELKTISLKETVELIGKMKNSTSRGNDDIDAFAIKVAAESLYKPINHVINCSLKTGRFPMKWKLGKIKPLLKNHEMDDQDPNSYRPVCLLPTISKLTEHAVQGQLLGHLEATSQLHRDHFAYRHRLNTTSALLQITSTMYKSTDQNNITTTMTVDMSDAFDCILHEIILRKLPLYNIGTKTCTWIRSYLEFRSNYVEIGDKQSKITPAPTGVPQGSCLGPLLYLIAMNEMPETIRDGNCKNAAHDNTEHLFGLPCNDCGSMPVFADDGIVLLTGRNRCENQSLIEKKFAAIKTFLQSNGLAVNDTKTGLIEIMTKQKRGRIKGDPPKLKVLIMEEGNLKEKVIEDKKVCRFL